MELIIFTKPARLPAVLPPELWDEVFSLVLNDLLLRRRASKTNPLQSLHKLVDLRRACRMFNQRWIQILFTKLDLTERGGFALFHFVAILRTSKRCLVKHVCLPAAQRDCRKISKFYNESTAGLTMLVAGNQGLRTLTAVDHASGNPSALLSQRWQQSTSRTQNEVSNYNVLTMCSAIITRLEISSVSLDMTTLGKLKMNAVRSHRVTVENVDEDDFRCLLQLCPYVQELEISGYHREQDRHSLVTSHLLSIVSSQYPRLLKLKANISPKTHHSQPLTDIGHYSIFQHLQQLTVTEPLLMQLSISGVARGEGLDTFTPLAELLPKSLRKLVVVSDLYCSHDRSIPALNAEYKSLLNHLDHDALTLIVVIRKREAEQAAQMPPAFDHSELPAILDKAALIVQSITPLQLPKEEDEHVSKAKCLREKVTVAHEEIWSAWEEAGPYDFEIAFTKLSNLFDAMDPVPAPGKDLRQAFRALTVLYEAMNFEPTAAKVVKVNDVR